MTRVHPDAPTLQAIAQRGSWLPPPEAVESARSAQEEARRQRERTRRALEDAQHLLRRVEEGGSGSDAETRRELAELREELAGLRRAMETRAVIEQAKGVIVATVHCDADAAFGVLVRQSQHSHIKLHDLAADIVSKAASASEG